MKLGFLSIFSEETENLQSLAQGANSCDAGCDVGCDVGCDSCDSDT